MESRAVRVHLIKYFKAFRDADMLYFTQQGAVYRQDELESVLEREDPDNLRMVTRKEIFSFNLS